MPEITTATVNIENMKTAAVLLALELVVTMQGKPSQYPGRVALLVEYEADKWDEINELLRLCRGGMYGIQVDAGKYQDAFRSVSRIIDEVRAGQGKEMSHG